MTGDLRQEKQKSVEVQNYLFPECIKYLTTFSILEILCGSDKLKNEATSL
jgi:hypothetical protein